MRGGFCISGSIKFLANIYSLASWAHEVVDDSEDGVSHAVSFSKVSASAVII